jgi:outer membrane protein assembly factor BamB
MGLVEGERLGEHLERGLMTVIGLRLITGWGEKLKAIQDPNNPQRLRSLNDLENEMGNRTVKYVLFALCLTQISFPGTVAANWLQFRGPEGRSIAPDQRLPHAFGPGQNQKWKTPLPSGHSSPCISRDHIFLTGYADNELKMLCLGRGDGRILWERTRPLKELQRYLHTASLPAIPTPCTDGKRVCFLFGDYGLVVLDYEGQLIWEKKFIPSTSSFGYGASPVIANDCVLINCDGGIRPSLLCLNLSNGDTIWQTDRPNTMCSHFTPFIWSPGTRREVLMGGSGTLTAYDLQSGTQNWIVTKLPGLVCTSPTADDSAVYYGAWTTRHVTGKSRVASLFGEEVNLTERETEDPQAFYKRFDTNGDQRISREELPPSRAREAFDFMDRNANGFWDLQEIATAFGDQVGWKGSARNVLVSVASGGQGDITDTHVRWENTRGLPYTASPLLYRNRLYYVKNGGRVTCLDPTSGNPHFAMSRLGASGEYYASPHGIGDKILFASRKGVMVTLRAGDQFDILQTVDLEEGITATPAMTENCLYVRTEHHLWCFAEARAVAQEE